MQYLVLALLLAGPQVAGTTTKASSTPTVADFSSVAARFWVNQAVQGAARLLRDPACGRVLADYTDRDGRSLADKLAALGVEPHEYLLKWIHFADARGAQQCNRGYEAIAFTETGSRVVYVCTGRLMSNVSSSAMRADVLLIHEMLHSLGLGENPPSSREITEHVVARCGK